MKTVKVHWGSVDSRGSDRRLGSAVMQMYVLTHADEIRDTFILVVSTFSRSLQTGSLVGSLESERA